MTSILVGIGRIAIAIALSLTWWTPSFSAAHAASDSGLLSARIETPNYTLSAAGVDVPSYASNTIPGAPRLPVHGITFNLPVSGDWELTFESVGSRVLDDQVSIPAVPVPDLDLNSPISLADLASLPSSVPVVDRPDPAIYNADAFYPSTPVLAGEPVQQGDARLLPVRVFPFQYNPVTGKLLYHPDLHITVHLSKTGISSQATVPANALPKPAIPAANVAQAARVHTRERGFHRLTYADLNAAGISVGPGGRDPRNFVLYNDGQPVDIKLVGGADGAFDPGDLVIFYAVPYTGRFQNYNVYSLAATDQPNSAIIASRPVSPTGVFTPASTITQTLHVEYDRDYRTQYERPMNVDHWFDTQLYANSGTPTVTLNYSLALDDPITTTGTLRLSAVIHGGYNQPANPDQSVVLRLNGHSIGQYTWDGRIDHTITAEAPAAWLDASPNYLTLEAALAQLPNLPFYWISPDWVELDYPALAEAEQDRLYVQAVASSSPDVVATGFTTPDVMVYDVRQPRHPVQLAGVAAQPAGAVFTVAWTDSVSSPSYYLSSQDALLAPSAVEADAQSNWGSPDHQATYIAIIGAQRSYTSTTTLGSQISAAVQPLLQHRTDEGMQVAEVDVLDIYDEFSYGKVDPQAIRDFLTYAYWNWNQGGARPHYVLLVGDGHYDFTKVSSQLLPNLIPPYLVHVDPWLGEVPADNRYVSTDGPDDYLPNMAVGRLPGNSAADISAMVNKTLTYEDADLNPPGPWQQRSIYVADDCADGSGNFHALSNDGRLQGLPTAYTDRKIYYDNPNNPVVCPDGTFSTSSQMRSAVRNAFDQGALFIQWFGHGSQTNWGSTPAFQHNDNPQLASNTRLPLTMANACLTGYFVWQSPFTDYPYMQSLAEIMLITPNKSSVVDFSPSGLHVGSALLTLQKGMHKALFEQRHARAGDVTDAAKLYYDANSFGWKDVIDSMILFGDPATKLRYPTGDLSASSMEAGDAAAPPGATLSYTVTVANSSIFTTTHPFVEVDYPQDLAVVADANGGDDDGDTISWTLPDLLPSQQQLVTFTLQANSIQPQLPVDLDVPAQVRSQMAPTVTLQVNTVITVAPDLSGSSLAASRAWLPPGASASFTATLENTGFGPSASTHVTLTLPSELAAPSALSLGLLYNAVAHQATWTGAVAVGQPQILAFTSPISSTLTACGQLTLDGAVKDEIGVLTPLSATVSLAVPDVNCSGDVDIADIQQVAARWPLPIGDPGYHPRYDLNADDAVDVLDIVVVAAAWD